MPPRTPFTDIEDADSDTYTPTDKDADGPRFLRATATYTDNAGGATVDTQAMEWRRTGY